MKDGKGLNLFSPLCISESANFFFLFLYSAGKLCERPSEGKRAKERKKERYKFTGHTYQPVGPLQGSRTHLLQKVLHIAVIRTFNYPLLIKVDVLERLAKEQNGMRIEFPRERRRRLPIG